jgi:hypothetical protein
LEPEGEESAPKPLSITDMEIEDEQKKMAAKKAKDEQEEQTSGGITDMMMQYK